MSWDISNRQILVETARSAGLWLMLAVLLFAAIAWVIAPLVTGNLPPHWTVGLGAFCGVMAVRLAVALVRRHRRSG